MKTVLLSTSFPSEPIIRQTPGSGGIWENYEFMVNQRIAACDIWVVLDDLPQNSVKCHAGATVLVTMEPEGNKYYSRGFLNQFDLVVTSMPKMEHRNIRHTCQGSPWHIGLDRGSLGLHGEDGFRSKMTYDDFISLPAPTKDRLISVICSSNSSLPGHRLRKRFVETLKQHFGSQIDIFGRDINPINDKWDAIAPYKYHVALENTSGKYYWSEKLGDAFLGRAFPLYWGCSNIGDYFESDSLTEIDISCPDEAIHTISEAIDNKYFEHRESAINESRERILHDYNTFNVASTACDEIKDLDYRKRTLMSQQFMGNDRPLMTLRSHIRNHLKLNR